MSAAGAPSTAPSPPGRGAAGAAAGADDVLFVAREGGWAGVLGLLGAALRYVGSIVLTRVLGAGAYGLYALANTVVTLVAMPANLGLPVSDVHFIAASEGRLQWARLRWVVRTSLVLVVVSSALWTLMLVAAAPVVSADVFRKEHLALPLAGLALALPLLGVTAVCSGCLQGLRNVRAKVFLERIAHPLVFTTLLLGGFWLQDLRYVLLCFFAAALAGAALGLTWLRRAMRRVPPPEGPPPRPWRALLSFATPVMFLNVLNYFIMRSDVLVMGLFRTAAEIGVYHVAAALAIVVNMPTEALNSSLAPNYARLHGRGEIDALERTFHASTRWILTLSSAIALVLVFGGPAFLWLFGREFQAGYAALCLLALGQLASAAMGTNGMLLTMTGYPHVNLANAIAMGAASFGLALLLVPRYGAAGAAAAAATSLALVNVIRCIELWAIFRILPWDRTVLKPAGALLLAVAAGAAALAAAGPLAAAAVGPATFALLWWVLGPERGDLDLLRRAVRGLRPSYIQGARGDDHRG